MSDLKNNEELFSFSDKKLNNTWAEIILPLAIPKTYTYSVPQHLLLKAKIGCRAEVVFGKNKKYAGIIKSMSNKKSAYETKEILNVIDDEAIIYPQQLLLWQWISEYYMCSEGEVMAAALPTHLKLSSEAIIIFNEDYGEDFSALDNEEYLVAEALLLKKELRLPEVQQILDVNHVYPIIKKLIEKKVCFVWEAFNEKYKPKKENYIILNPEFNNEEKLSELLNNWSRAPKQLELLLSYLHLLKTEGEVIQTALLKKSNATAAQLKGLAEKNILFIEKRKTDRIHSLPQKISIDFDLSHSQQIALDEINNSFSEKKVCLLHGITSSGKTQLYIRQIEKYINEGKQVLYLLPEITLTAQIIRRLQKNFGGNIAIYHSKFNNNERVELWNKIKNGEVKIILGARSALFLPFKNLGLIIIDEEHDSSYKQQEPAPRYNARDAAIFYATLFDAKVLLGSATPSMESFYNVKTNKYGLVELNERFGGVELPEIKIINTRQVAASKKGKVMLSPQLKAAIEDAIANERQVILFQNRRGYSPFLICATCGFIPHCNNCDVTLTLHKFSNKMHCHYCGTNYPKLTTCPACGTVNWMEKNFGTEKIEEELENEFPSFRIARMDIDSVRGKLAHDNLIKLFEQHRIDILVGTQMVVKGLDFEKVSLVGVLDADGLLSFADFRVNERAFQLMEQVSGRAGRKTEQGKVMIQAAKINHPVLLLVQQHDYKRFYEFEIENRKRFFYPPFSRAIKIILKHKIKEVVNEASDVLGDALKKDMNDFVVGPAAPVINRIRSMYLMELLIKLPKDAFMLQQYKKVIANHFNLLHAEKKFRSVILIADVDTM
ncbi:MAG: primosomal protein N' [Bacteroidota bacterium]|nr:primosomal protein N' [Bacteroidota bacterium]